MCGEHVVAEDQRGQRHRNKRQADQHSEIINVILDRIPVQYEDHDNHRSDRKKGLQNHPLIAAFSSVPQRKKKQKDGQKEQTRRGKRPERNPGAEHRNHGKIKLIRKRKEQDADKNQGSGPNVLYRILQKSAKGPKTLAGSLDAGLNPFIHLIGKIRSALVPLLLFPGDSIRKRIPVSQILGMRIPEDQLSHIPEINESAERGKKTGRSHRRRRRRRQKQIQKKENRNRKKQGAQEILRNIHRDIRCDLSCLTVYNRVCDAVLSAPGQEPHRKKNPVSGFNFRVKGFLCIRKFAHCKASFLIALRQLLFRTLIGIGANLLIVNV